MSATRFRLTPQLRAQIVAGIRAGGYPHVAAEAWGVPKDVFDNWLKRGAGAGAREPYLSFDRDIREAFAQARLRAEMSVFENDPKAWLEHGPGRETPNLPGWSGPVKPTDAPPTERNVLLDTEVMSLLRTLMNALLPYPEARSHVAQALVNAGISESHTK